MPKLQRITTVYVDSEDRIRLTGETVPGQTVVLWLTRRLLDRLLPPIFDWLVRKTGADPRGEIIQSFAQQAATATLKPEASVRSSKGSLTMLVHTANINGGTDGLQIAFRPSGEPEPGEDPVVLALASRPLRQWLGIVHHQYRRAGWPLEAWPDWMNEAKAATGQPPDQSLH